MLFSEQLKKEAKPIINQIYHDPFIQGMLHGNLPIEATKFYLRADASYLNEFANIYALLIPKMENLNDVRFLVEQIQFIVDGEVEAHEILADYVQESYNEIVQEKVWPPSGDHYIKHMYFNAYAKENAAYTIAAMAPCPYVYQVIAQEALRDKELNKDSILAKWFEFYSTEMDELVIVFDNLMDKLTKHCSEKEKNEIKQCFLQSTVHERNFFNMSFNEESWSYGGMKNE
ncbi:MULTISPECIES: thiaminase II [Staphylococcus]|uniref:Aminopyrimidine aminohydrolase n=1 Tax=Staphylococcus saprophyticus TaxID=29385 RepID=A0A380HK59_STASA|nr:thiaminase II [Staphylococcus saprophyticus]EHY93109.1 putative transcriptional regulator [Staphylococcus saprophyticus subsp. saprophyticus KACC 16562]KIJ85835.1 thiaminase [Staphylococcus saprophyticus]MBF2753601.1 thiaminase II [Staphylococcus saprophyticus]MBF2780013.1 thiaminase II [Staphylococcus saprophyticus]MBF2782162.1 thiaminase II [Staphylococcus saprophyticus]